MTCQWCDEPIEAGDPPHMEGFHRECALRAMLGSVGHQLGMCACHGGAVEDLPGRTRRQAARDALRVFEMRRQSREALN